MSDVERAPTVERAEALVEPLVFLHVGDLHLTTPTAQNARDFRAILAQIDGIGSKSLFDFVYLPGDLAENGCASEYTELAAALDAHRDLPIRLIPGDHDRQLGRMDDFQAFYDHLVASRKLTPPMEWVLDQPPLVCPLPPAPEIWPPRTILHYCASEDIRGIRCLFLDIVSPGYGQKGIGLDFRLGREQTLWLNDQIRTAADKNIPVAVFMHAYPDDLREPDDRLDIGGLFWEAGIRLVEMGHTHYNELAHDGHTLYAAARSVGQNEDGSVGYAVSAIDGPVTSWRFKALDRAWPFVLITSPADRRVATRPATTENAGMVGDGRGRIRVRAVVLSDVPPQYVHCRAGTGAWHPMERVTGRVYEAWLPWPKEARRIQVEAVHPDWRGHGPDLVDTDVIEPVIVFDDPESGPPIPEKPGSDVPNIGAWIQKGVRGDQLGPNRHGRKW
ncbi:metallophosphoesterase family protein [Methylobacterium sp. J-068]|uniref:metallophosphoesterase family protein n=1 Tax=Methylobacterium sp. J-068 TaxID=2836649 RepID=UPI001FB8B50A|nr:metallophosphoesterase [Methylobacterium sp. J-068]MCJ2033939.1 metallophosphoesterase [Methylobacterium sp. J-068]